MQIKEMAENMGYEVLHGIVDCLWVIGEPISVFKEAVEKETGILPEADTYDWITFLPMSDGTGAYNRYFGRLNTGKMKIRGVMARKGTRRSTSTKCNRRSSKSWLWQGA
jgi:DNA polymerase I